MLAGLVGYPAAGSTAVIQLARRLVHVAYCDRGKLLFAFVFRDVHCPRLHTHTQTQQSDNLTPSLVSVRVCSCNARRQKADFT